jgi:HAD superfamily hydrolase (TIGR01549 family)
MPPREAIIGETRRRVDGLLQGWGIELTEEQRFLSRNIRFAVEEATEKAFWGDSCSPHYATLCREVAARLGSHLNDSQAELLWDTWNLGGQFLGRQLFADALDTLRWLRQSGYRLGSVTNRGYSGPHFRSEMRNLGLAELFEVVAVSCEVGYMKPHPRIFQHALEAMGLSSQETAMVGDHLHADVAGAKGLGMTAIWRRPPRDEPVEATTDEPDNGEQAIPDYVIDNIGDLKGLPIFADG